MPGTALGTRDRSVNQTQGSPALRELIIYLERATITYNREVTGTVVTGVVACVT